MWSPGGMEGCVGKIWQQLGGSDSTRTDGKVPRSEESASLKGRSHPAKAIGSYWVVSS